MGCGASKGKSGEKETKIEFKDIGVGSMDNFFQKCKDIIDQFNDSTTPMDNAKDELFSDAEFIEVPGSKAKHVINGIILFFGTLAAGDLNRVIKFTSEPPFIHVDFGGFTGVVDFAKKLFEGFKEWGLSLKTIAEEKLPGLLKTAEELPGEAEDVRSGCMGEFEALDIMKKGKALMAVALNIKILAKIPMVIKAMVTKLKDLMIEIKDAIMELKDNIVKLAKDALECISKKLTKPYDCYKQAFGPIKYTQAERTEWEAMMKKRCEKLGKEWKPEDYPKTDMIADPPAAPKK